MPTTLPRNCGDLQCVTAAEVSQVWKDADDRRSDGNNTIGIFCSLNKFVEKWAKRPLTSEIWKAVRLRQIPDDPAA